MQAIRRSVSVDGYLHAKAASRDALLVHRRTAAVELISAVRLKLVNGSYWTAAYPASIAIP